MIHCPKCNEPMSEIEYAHVRVDQCNNCRGLFFDMLEFETLADAEGAEAIDTGDPGIGLSLDNASPVSCPKCQTPMQKEYDPLQPQIQYEVCTQCFGTFLDAGEFRDFKENIVIDSLRRRAQHGRSES